MHTSHKNNLFALSKYSFCPTNNCFAVQNCHLPFKAFICPMKMLTLQKDLLKHLNALYNTCLPRSIVLTEVSIYNS